LKYTFKYLTLFLLIISLIACNKKDTEKKSNFNYLIGSWSLDNVERNNGHIDSVPENEKYQLILNSINSVNTFKDDDDSGSWKLEGSTLSFQNIPTNTTTYIDSVLIINDNNGNSKAVLKTGDTEVATINNKGVIAEKVNSSFELIYVNDNSLKLYKDGNLFNYTKNKLIVSKSNFSLTYIIKGIIGILFFLFLAWLFSSNRKAINWKLVAKGIALQIIIALMVLKLPIVESAFDAISTAFVTLISYTDYGVNFLFKSIIDGTMSNSILNFAFKILPTIIFFSALVSLFYYWGIIQKVVYGFAWIMKKFMSLSGAESLAAAGNVFLGQTESPLLVKPYLNIMTKSEMMCLMTGGMATIAGGVLAAYVGFLGGDDPVEQAFFAKHLMTASIISAPAAIVAAKILVPETEEINENLSIPKDKIGSNALEAISNGTSDGLKLAINVGAMLLVFIAIMALCNGILSWVGGVTNVNTLIADNTPYANLSFEFLLGYLGRPLVWIMGVSWEDSLYVGELLGIKTILNEFVAYPRLGEMKAQELISKRSIIMSTYLLCGFANFASIGIQIGGIGSLVPNRKGLLSKLGIKALIGGTIACILTATVVGMMI
jgi:concentrative nucleoside transporter, CNT family